MPSTLVVIRLTKILMVATTALLHTLIALNNITDYETNYIFTQHVLAMDTTTRHSGVVWRAITSPFAQHGFYVVVILWEIAVAILCCVGSYKCVKAIRDDSSGFNAAKNVAVCGLAVSIMLWMFGFLTIAGEWFVMWQSPTWNGQPAALRMFIVTGFCLIFLTQSEREYDDHSRT